MERIVNNMPATTPVAILNLNNNTLTKIPANLPKYTQLKNLLVSQNNITSVKANEVALTANVSYLDLSSNQISIIEAGSLPGKNDIVS